MPNFAIATDEALTLGQKYQGLANNPWGHERDNQPFVPVREITWEEFVEIYVSFAPDDRDGALWMCVFATKFYEIVTD